MQDYNKQFSALLASGEDDARDLQGLNKEVSRSSCLAGRCRQMVCGADLANDADERV
jgi:hypothetical protein|eukprot:SAG25_NODE_242_length_11160_cov_254.065546_7_plen_57_part_00